jgi:hypothetical protein
LHLVHKNLPSHEYVLEDDNGSKDESHLVCKLFYNIYDGFYPLDYKIQINPVTGNFMNEIITSSLISSTTFVHNSPFGGANDCEVSIFKSGDPVIFEYCTTSIQEWNSLNLEKDPASDCVSLPCDDILGHCID